MTEVMQYRIEEIVPYEGSWTLKHLTTDSLYQAIFRAWECKVRGWHDCKVRDRATDKTVFNTDGMGGAWEDWDDESRLSELKDDIHRIIVKERGGFTFG